MTIRYISTRGSAPALGFEDVVLAGLASDGGLYVPETLPEFSPAEIAGFAGLDYVSLAERILAPFVADALTPRELRELLEASYSHPSSRATNGSAAIHPSRRLLAQPPQDEEPHGEERHQARLEPWISSSAAPSRNDAVFRHAAIAPLTQLGHNQFVLELFHGPTLAFKDFALQWLGNLLDHILKKRGQTAVVLGATSGDTGSAAISGCRGRDNVQIFILHPHERVSEVQRRQMTTVADANVHNLAVKGTFDDCQDIVKSLFADSAFREKHNLVAVNSINWARILAQVVYYFYAACALGAPARQMRFVVPTGNFGDIYAGYIARRMGLPIEKLVIATNRNDILARCLKTGNYAMEGVVPTLSPSMDIQVSSNFERLLFDLHERDGARINAMMQEFRTKRSITLSPQALNRMRNDFAAHAADDAATKAVIKNVYETTGWLADPHTAVGIAAAHALATPSHVPVITLSTAHPAKFPQAVEAATGVYPALPAHLQDILTRKERCEVVENDLNAIKSVIEAI